MTPIIALAPQVSPKHGTVYMNHEYSDCIIAAGGLPLVLPLGLDKAILTRYTKLCDGLLLTGGHDIAPAIYGEETRPDCGPTVPERDEMEMALLDLFLAEAKPVLGICRGIQLINAHLGGTLWQHLPAQCPSEVEHNQSPPYSEPAHYVNLSAPLSTMLGCEKLQVNSLHHQAVKSPAPSLKPVAWSPDGLIEAIHDPARRFFWAVQWHPEKLREPASGSEKLFSAFVEACRR